jgi:transcriptional regulator with XRE-family HTH domain
MPPRRTSSLRAGPLSPVAEQLRFGREIARLTQAVAARRLGVSQPYLSQLELGRRRLTARVARRAARVYGLSPTVLPITFEWRPRKGGRSAHLAEQLSALGYPGSARGNIRSEAAVNPADVVLGAISADEVEARSLAGIVWVLARFPDLDWAWLVSKAKQRNLQNRLGYLTSVASEVLERDAALRAIDPARLQAALTELEKSRLAAEATLCRESMTNAERVVLRANRPALARHWNVLADLSASSVKS